MKMRGEKKDKRRPQPFLSATLGEHGKSRRTVMIPRFMSTVRDEDWTEKILQCPEDDDLAIKVSVLYVLCSNN